MAKLLKFGTKNKRAWEIELSSGGDLEIYLEPMRLTA
jgi:hypothetical protein